MSPARRPANGRGDGELSLRAWAEEAEAAAGIARALAPTAFVPDQLRRYVNPDERDPRKKQLDLDATVATVTAVLLAGQELGLGPMASLRSITIIKNTVALYAIAARALLLHAGHEIVVRESTSSRAIVDARRAPDGEWQRSTWDTDRARTAGLLPGHVDGNWRKNPKGMLVARATAEASRWIAADAMLGLPVMVEELDDDGQPDRAAIESVSTPDRPPTPEPPAIEPPKGKTRATGRRTPPRRASLPSAAPLPAPPEQPPPPEPPGRARPRLTKAQSTRIHASLRDMGITGAAEGLALLSAWAERTVESSGDLTPEEAATVIDRLDALLSIAQRPADAAATADDEGQAADAERRDAEHDAAEPADPEGAPPSDAQPD